MWAGAGAGLAQAAKKAPSAVPGAEASESPNRRQSPRYACDYPARVVSSEHLISTSARIVNISQEGAKVEVMFPVRGPTIVMLFDLANSEVYECEIRWRTDFFIGVRFLDILGPARRRRFFAGETVPLKSTMKQFIRLENPPVEEVAGKAPPPQWRSDTEGLLMDGPRPKPPARRS